MAILVFILIILIGWFYGICMMSTNNKNVSDAASLVSKQISLYLPEKTELVISISFIKNELTGFQVGFEVGGDMNNLRMHGLSKRHHSLRLHSSIIGWECNYDGGCNNTSELHPNLKKAFINFARSLRETFDESVPIKTLASNKIKNFTITVNSQSIAINHIAYGYGHCITTSKGSNTVLERITHDNNEIEHKRWGVATTDSDKVEAYNGLFSMLEPLMREYGSSKQGF